MRLNAFLARAGVASRRRADELIKAGRVTVNGVPGQLNTVVGPRDRVEVDGRTVEKQRLRYVLLHKPAGVVTTAHDPQGRPTVVELVPGDPRVVVVVKDPSVESPSKLRELAPEDLDVVHSSAAWEDFDVAMSPYFCFVDGITGEVRSEGSAMTWEQVASLLRDALLDEEVAARR